MTEPNQIRDDEQDRQTTGNAPVATVDRTDAGDDEM